MCNVTFRLPAFHKHRDITWNTHVDETPEDQSKYDMIIGCDLMHELNMDILFSRASIVWDNAEVLMQDPDQLKEANLESFEQELFMAYDPETTWAETECFLAHDPETTDAERIQSIIDLKYTKHHLEDIVDELNNISKSQQQQLLNILKKFESLFDGTLGCWKTKPIELELKDPNCKSYHAKPYPVPNLKNRN